MFISKSMYREHWITKVNKSVINIKGLVKCEKNKGDSLNLYTMPITKTVHSKRGFTQFIFYMFRFKSSQISFHFCNTL